MKNILAILLIFFSLYSFAQSNTKFGKEVVKMIELSGGEEGFNVILEEIITNAKEFRSDIPGPAWAEIEDELKIWDKSDLYNILIPIYERHFTVEEIIAINQFLTTQAGKKFAEKLPILTGETIQAGKIWGISIAKNISDRLREKGY